MTGKCFTGGEGVNFPPLLFLWVFIAVSTLSSAIQYFNALNYPILASSFNGKYQTMNLDFVLLIMFLFVHLANVHKTHGPSWTIVDHGVCEHGLRLQSRSRAH